MKKCMSFESTSLLDLATQVNVWLAGIQSITIEFTNYMVTGRKDTGEVETHYMIIFYREAPSK